MTERNQNKNKTSQIVHTSQNEIKRRIAEVTEDTSLDEFVVDEDEQLDLHLKLRKRLMRKLRLMEDLEMQVKMQKELKTKKKLVMLQKDLE
jgi:hypothetical protein